MNTSNKENDMVLVTNKNFNEKDYLTSNSDIAKAIQEGVIDSARKHFNLYGRNDPRESIERVGCLVLGPCPFLFHEMAQGYVFLIQLVMFNIFDTFHVFAYEYTTVTLTIEKI